MNGPIVYRSTRSVSFLLSNQLSSTCSALEFHSTPGKYYIPSDKVTVIKQNRRAYVALDACISFRGYAEVEDPKLGIEILRVTSLLSPCSPHTAGLPSICYREAIDPSRARVVSLFRTATDFRYYFHTCCYGNDVVIKCSLFPVHIIAESIKILLLLRYISRKKKKASKFYFLSSSSRFVRTLLTWFFFNRKLAVTKRHYSRITKID